MKKILFLIFLSSFFSCWGSDKNSITHIPQERTRVCWSHNHEEQTKFGNIEFEPIQGWEIYDSERKIAHRHILVTTTIKNQKPFTMIHTEYCGGFCGYRFTGLSYIDPNIPSEQITFETVNSTVEKKLCYVPDDHNWRPTLEAIVERYLQSLPK